MHKPKCRWIFAALFLLAVLCSGCGSSQKEVPEALVQELIQESSFAKIGSCTWEVTHSVNSQTHRDSVDILLTTDCTYGSMVSSCSAVYEYDRSSDLWRLLQQSKWTEPKVSFTSGLIKNWQIDYFDNTYHINVTNISGNKISLEYTVKEEIVVDYFGDIEWWETSGLGSFDIGNGYIEIPLELPDRYFVSWKDTESGENEQVTYLRIQFSPNQGVEYAYISPTIHVWKS